MAKPSRSPSPPPALLQQAELRLVEARRLRQNGKIADAAKMTYGVVQALPDHVPALRLMASIAMQTGTPQIATETLARALAAGSPSSDLLVDLGEALTAAAKPAEAVSAFKRALTLRPKNGAAFRGLGQAQLDLGNPADALKSFRKAVAILPYDDYCAHMITALSGEPSKLANDYVPTLFDTYAEMFDEHLTGTLQYRAPDLIAAMLEHQAPQARFAAALDIGCGTGLVGAALKDMVETIDGLDVSANMTRKTRERGIYRHLRTGHVTSLLATDPDLAGPYDLVVAADVFVYVGPLEASFEAIAKRLPSGGLFACTVETGTGDQTIIRSSGRFGHPPLYIANLAALHGLAIVVQQDITVRLERNAPIPGQLYLLSRV